jgi:histone acetyltransferase (RNA polymerase elongator complex component)
MSSLKALIKKREQIDREIEQLKERQKRKERIGELAAEARLLEISDDELRAAFKQIADRKPPPA